MDSIEQKVSRRPITTVNINSRDSSENIHCRDTFDEVNDNIIRAVKLDFIEISVCVQCSTTKIIMRCHYGAKLVIIDPFNVVCQFLS